MLEFGKTLRAILFGMLSFLVFICETLVRASYGVWWKFNIAEGDLCTFRDVTTRQRVPLLGSGVGRVVEVNGGIIKVERITPQGADFLSRSWKLKYLSRKEWEEMRSKIMVAGLAGGLKSRGL